MTIIIMIMVMISTKGIRELIVELNDADESESLEAKLGTEVGRSILETICSMSNEPAMGGGTILIGVSKEEMSLFPMFTAIGVDNPEKISSEIASQCASVFNIPIRIDLSRETIGRRAVVRVDVPELVATQKPLYFKAQSLPRGAFRRIGSTDQRCNEDDLQAFYQSKSFSSPDKSVVDGARWDDIDLEAIDAYRRARQKLNPLAEELNWSDGDLLKALNCAVEHDNRMKITTTGLVSFGKYAALRRLDPSTRVDYIRVPGKSWVSSPDNLESIEIRGPTLKIAGRVISTILDDVPKALKFVDGSPQRTDMPLIPERVVREAVINALAHRNYQSHEPIQVLRYSNRIEIRNPGYSLKSEDRFDEPGSTLRNPHVAEILHETRFAESKGSGIRVMRQKMRESGLTEPTFISSREDDKFSVVFLLHHFLSEQDWIWLAQFKDFQLQNEQLRALIYMREMGAIDNACYRNLNQVDTLEASSSLRKLKEVNLILSKGSGSRTYYVPGPQLEEVDRRITSDLKKSSFSFNPQGKTLPRNIAVQIGNLGKRIEPATFEALIEQICTWQPSSAEEIASWLGRSRNYVTNKFLFRMVRDGRLLYTIPDMVKHPAQRYTTSGNNMT